MGPFIYEKMIIITEHVAHNAYYVYNYMAFTAVKKHNDFGTFFTEIKRKVLKALKSVYYNFELIALNYKTQGKKNCSSTK